MTKSLPLYVLADSLTAVDKLALKDEHAERAREEEALAGGPVGAAGAGGLGPAGLPGAPPGAVSGAAAGGTFWRTFREYFASRYGPERAIAARPGGHQPGL